MEVVMVRRAKAMQPKWLLGALLWATLMSAAFSGCTLDDRKLSTEPRAYPVFDDFGGESGILQGGGSGVAGSSGESSTIQGGIDGEAAAGGLRATGGDASGGLPFSGFGGAGAGSPLGGSGVTGSNTGQGGIPSGGGATNSAGSGACSASGGGTALGGGGAEADLDGNGISDRLETLVKNPGFDLDAAGWSGEGGALISWTIGDANKPGSPGCISLIQSTMADAAGTSTGAAQQCVAAAGGQSYRLHAQALLNRPLDSGGSTAVGLAFYSSVDCSGDPLSSHNAPPASFSNLWLPLSDAVTAPPGSRSVAVRLLVSKVTRLPALQVLFDNVLFKACP
jgi:hypothetical protein